MCNEIKLITGANAQFQIEVLNEDGTAHSLAGYSSIEMEIRKKPGVLAVWRATLIEGLSRSGNVITANLLLDFDVAEGVYYTDVDLIKGSVITTPPQRIKVLIAKGITKQTA